MLRSFRANSADHPIVCFLARAGLTVGIAAMFFAPPSSSTKAARTEAPPAATTSVNLRNGTLVIGYSGPIAPGMADFLRSTFAQYATVSHRVLIFFNSLGGQVEEGERVIHILEQIKQTHRLDTAVAAGRVCASMCLPLFLAGKDRFAAPASLWLFHEVTRRDTDGREHMDPEETGRLFRRYYLPAGVSPEWLRSIAPAIRNADLWKTGADLISAKTGVITNPLENRTERAVVPPPSH
jgi:ATP-dependent protease ClpP protease subunit